MLHFLSGILIFILSSYLSFANFFADQLTFFLSQTENQNLHTLPSTYAKNSDPSILRQSVDYQRANVIDIRPSLTTTDPLEALVNIYCTFITDRTVRVTTGTGFFIHSNGAILTNAHVAQYLLLAKTQALGQAECIIRTGNPAVAKYKADLLYISPAWIQKNATALGTTNPTGTGERDYALLYVTDTASNHPLPQIFPALEIDTELLPRTLKNQPVTALGYPAGNLSKNGGTAFLLPKMATSSVSELYTFGSNYADVFSIRGSIIGEQGSSGGPILNKDGQVIGVIVTRGDDTIDGAGSLRAITLSHIDRTITEETGFSLERNLGGDLAFRADIFAKTLTPFLIQILTREIPQTTTN